MGVSKAGIHVHSHWYRITFCATLLLHNIYYYVCCVCILYEDKTW